MAMRFIALLPLISNIGTDLRRKVKSVFQNRNGLEAKLKLLNNRLETTIFSQAILFDTRHVNTHSFLIKMELICRKNGIGVINKHHLDP